MKKLIVGSFLALAASFLYGGAGIISVNVSEGGNYGQVPADDEMYGLAPAPGKTWINTTKYGYDIKSSTLPLTCEYRDGAKKVLSGLNAEFYNSSDLHLWGQVGDIFFQKYYDVTATVTIENVPYRQYDLIVYISAYDNNSLNAIPVNGTYYTYDAESQSTVVGNKSWGCWQNTVAEGLNTLRIPFQHAKTLTFSCWRLAAFQIVENLEDPGNPKGVISVNFNNGNSYHIISDKAGEYGALAGSMVLAGSWNDFSGSSTWKAIEETPLKVWDGENFYTVSGEDSGVTLASDNTVAFWNSDQTDAHLMSHFDGGCSTPGLRVTNIPWDLYDVIVYRSCAYGSAFNPVALNGVLYTWSDLWGMTVQGADPWGHPSGEGMSRVSMLGVNALRVNGLSAKDLLIDDSKALIWDYTRNVGGLAAFQIVKRIPDIATNEVTTAAINAIAKPGEPVYVSLPAGGRFVVTEPLTADKVCLCSAGNIVLVSDTPIADDDPIYAKLDFAGVSGTAFHSWLGNGSSISVNFGAGSASRSVEGAGFDGYLAGAEIPKSSWNNDNQGPKLEVPLKFIDGYVLVPTNDTCVSMTRANGGTYGDYNYPTTLQRGWINSADPGLAISGIPWEFYDVVVYFGRDYGDTFNPLAVNGKLYTWSNEEDMMIEGDDQWGDRSTSLAPLLGKNALKVEGLFGSTCLLNDNATLYGHMVSYKQGSIAGVQIVKRVDIEAAGDLTTAEINALAAGKDVVYITIPAGKKLVITHSLTCGKVCIGCRGDLILDTDHRLTERDDETLAKLDLTAVQGLVFHGWQPVGTTVSINFNANGGEMSGHALDQALGGEIPADSWNNITNAANAVCGLQAWDGRTCTIVPAEESGITLTRSSGSFYTSGNNTRPFMNGMIEDATPGIQISGIPLETYDVIVYFACGYGTDFNPVAVNGKVYTYANGAAVEGEDYWGVRDKSLAPAFGVNAIKVKGVTGSTLIINDSTTLYGLVGGYTHVGAITAIQIVEPMTHSKYRGTVIILR